MKWNNQKFISILTIAAVGLLAMIQVSCDTTISSQVDHSGTPQIQGVRYVSPDSSGNVQEIGPGAVVVLQGKNMDATANVYFNGYEAPFNPTLASDTTLVVTVPSDMPFGEMDPESESFNTIRVSNSNGESVLDFPVLPPAPQINSISDEFAEDGQQITLGGQYLYLVSEVVFPGDVAATEFQASADGTSMTVRVPDGAGSGDISVVTSAGSSTTATGVGFRDPTGMICNFDDMNPYVWGAAGIMADASMHPGNEGQYALLDISGMSSGDAAWWTGGRSINWNGSQWIDAANVSEAPGNFAIKFEVSVQDAWSNGTLFIRTANPWSYTARIEPWRDGSSFTTNMWHTIEIPLDEFKTANGEGMNGAGDALQSLSDLLPSGAASSPGMMFMNDTDGVVQSLNMAVDNIRVVRIAN